MNRDPIPFRIPVRRAGTWLQRARGLLGAPPLPSGQGLLLSPCRSVHTIGLRRPIDVVFVDRRGVVISLRRGLAPMRGAFCIAADATLELRAGEIARLGLWTGCRIEFVEMGIVR